MSRAKRKKCHKYHTTYIYIIDQIYRTGLIAAMKRSKVETKLQGDLSIKDTLGPVNLSTVERLSTLQR